MMANKYMLCFSANYGSGSVLARNLTQGSGDTGQARSHASESFSANVAPGLAGSLMVKVEPLSSSLLTSNVPPWPFTDPKPTDNPSPGPPHSGLGGKKGPKTTNRCACSVPRP